MILLSKGRRHATARGPYHFILIDADLKISTVSQ